MSFKLAQQSMKLSDVKSFVYRTWERRFNIYLTEWCVLHVQKRSVKDSTLEFSVYGDILLPCQIIR